MKGQILTFDPLQGEGIISGEDGNRYTFSGAEWKGALQQLRAGVRVDFDSAEGRASGVFPMPGMAPMGFHQQPHMMGERSPIAAGLLALFLGPWGIHKFYLGYTSEGVILLVGTFVSFILCFIIIGIIPLMAIGVIVFVEAIIYLTKSPEEFQRIYVDHRRPWF